VVAPAGQCLEPQQEHSTREAWTSGSCLMTIVEVEESVQLAQMRVPLLPDATELWRGIGTETGTKTETRTVLETEVETSKMTETGPETETGTDGSDHILGLDRVLAPAPAPLGGGRGSIRTSETRGIANPIAERTVQEPENGRAHSFDEQMHQATPAVSDNGEETASDRLW